MTDHELVYGDRSRVMCSCGWRARLRPSLQYHAETVFDAHRLVALVDEFTAAVDVG